MKLSYRARQQLPSSAFAGPNRSFPIEDALHAHNALARAHFAANPGAVRAAVHNRYPNIGQHVRAELKRRASR